MQKTASVTGLVMKKGTMKAGIWMRETTFSRVHILTWSEPAPLIARPEEVVKWLAGTRVLLLLGFNKEGLRSCWDRLVQAEEKGLLFWLLDEELALEEVAALRVNAS